MSMDDLVRPEDILGLEVYLAKGEIPVEWDDTRSECGVVVVWTRDR
jgi:hypothetical protein